MSRWQVDLVRQGYEAWNAGDMRWVLDHLAPGVEWVAAADNPDPDTYRGYEGVERFWQEWRASVGQLRFEPEQFVEADEQVLVVARRTGRGEHSGAVIADRIVQVFTFGSDGKRVRVEEFFDERKALEAIGRPQATPGS
jgi:ketosteroid isomerase-like protein